MEAPSDVTEISVIIPHYNDLQALKKCLESVERQSLPRAQYEVIVADNNSPGGLGGLPSDFPGIRFLTVHERGAACARNAGMAVASGGVFAFIDADCVASPDWLEHGVKALQDADLSGGDVEVSLSSDMTPVECFEAVFAFRQRLYVERKKFSVTANLIVKAAAAAEIGSFSNGVAEDLDWCHRAVALGFRLVFNDTSRVFHPARRDWNELVSKWDRLVRERWNGFGATTVVRRGLWICLAVATALSAGPHLWAVAKNNRLQTIKHKTKAAIILLRIRFWRATKMMSHLHQM